MYILHADCVFWPLDLQHKGMGPAQLMRDVDKASKHKTLFRFWFGPLRPSVVCVHPDTVKVIMQSSAPKSLSGKGGYSLLLPWLGKYGHFSPRKQHHSCLTMANSMASMSFYVANVSPSGVKHVG